MSLDELTVTEQAAELERIVRLNPIVDQILARLSTLALPDCWLAAGALFQTVWNVLCDRDPRAGILDYDVNYSLPSLPAAPAMRSRPFPTAARASPSGSWPASRRCSRRTGSPTCSG